MIAITKLLPYDIFFSCHFLTFSFHAISFPVISSDTYKTKHDWNSGNTSRYSKYNGYIIILGFSVANHCLVIQLYKSWSTKLIDFYFSSSFLHLSFSLLCNLSLPSLLFYPPSHSLSLPLSTAITDLRTCPLSLLSYLSFSNSFCF